jgi:hypothetical protein
MFDLKKKVMRKRVTNFVERFVRTNIVAVKEIQHQVPANVTKHLIFYLTECLNTNNPHYIDQKHNVVQGKVAYF